MPGRGLARCDRGHSFSFSRRAMPRRDSAESTGAFLPLSAIAQRVGLKRIHGLLSVIRRGRKRSDPTLEMMALVVGQRHGDRIFVLADKLSVFTGSLAGEGPSRALHHNCFTGPRDMNRLGWDAVKLRERALDGFVVDVGLIHFASLNLEYALSLAACTHKIANCDSDLVKVCFGSLRGLSFGISIEGQPRRHRGLPRLRTLVG
jgi:hypothetical protein